MTIDLIAPVLAFEIWWAALAWAPREFWRGYSAEHRDRALFLWGFTHPFIKLREGDPPPWEK